MYQQYSRYQSQNQQTQTSDQTSCQPSGLEIIAGDSNISGNNTRYSSRPRAGQLAVGIFALASYLTSLILSPQIDPAYADGQFALKRHKSGQGKTSPSPKKKEKNEKKKSAKPKPETHEQKVERPRLINTAEGYQKVNIRAYPPAELVQDPQVISGQRLVEYLRTQDLYKKELWDDFVIKTARDYYNQNKAYCDNKLGITDFSGFEKLLNESKGVQLVSDKTNHRVVFSVNSNNALDYQVSIVNGQVRSRGLQFFVSPMSASVYELFDEAAGKLNITFQKEKQDETNKLLTAARYSNILVVQHFDAKSLSDEQRIALGIQKNIQLNNSSGKGLYEILNINDPVLGYASRDLHDRRLNLRPIKGTEAVSVEAFLITYGTAPFNLAASLRSTQSQIGEKDLMLGKKQSVVLELGKVPGLSDWILDTINLSPENLKNKNHLLYDPNPKITFTPLSIDPLSLRTDVVRDHNVLKLGFPIDFIIGMFGGNGISLGQYDKLVKVSQEFSLNYTISMKNEQGKFIPYDPQSLKITLEPKPVNLREHSGEGLLYSILGSLLISNGVKSQVDGIFIQATQPLRTGGPSGTAPSRTGGGHRLWIPSSEIMRELKRESNLHSYVDFNGILLAEDNEFVIGREIMEAHKKEEKENAEHQDSEERKERMLSSIEEVLKGKLGKKFDLQV